MQKLTINYVHRRWQWMLEGN